MRTKTQIVALLITAKVLRLNLEHGVDISKTFPLTNSSKRETIVSRQVPVKSFLSRRNRNDRNLQFDVSDEMNYYIHRFRDQYFLFEIWYAHPRSKSVLGKLTSTT